MGSRICLCCGTASHQTSRPNKNYMPVVRPPPHCWVQCLNSQCSRAQRLDCAVDFCRSVVEKTPKRIWATHPWVCAILPVLRGVDPQDDIPVLNCISCSLSSGISPDLKIKLSKMVAPSNCEAVVVKDPLNKVSHDIVNSKDPLHLGKRK